jgi:diguanylate cyclase (GGDEF)-like protein/PAS domain S-box-containing protein
MSDRDKTKAQLIKELGALRLKLDTVKAAAADQRKAEKTILDSEKKYRSLFENAADAMYLIDPETQKIIDCNRKASILTGYPLTELKAMTLLDLHPTEEQDVVAQILKKLTLSGSLSAISGINQLTKDGTLVPLEIDAAILEINNKKCYLAISRDITERKQAVSELKKSEEKYRALFKHMFIGFALHKIVVDNKDQPIDYIFLEINDSFERLTGLKRDNIAGKKVTEIIPHISQEKPDLIKIFGDVALKGDVAKFELQFKPFNKWYSVSAYSPMKGYFVSLFDDITLRKYWEDKLRENEEKYRRLFEGAYDAIFIVDPETGSFLDANENAAKRLGYSHEELLRLKIGDIEKPLAAEPNSEIMRDLNEKGTLIYEHTHRRKDGSELPVEISSRLVEYGGMKVMECFVRDITERIKTENAIQESEKRFRDISENAREWIWEVDKDGRYTYSGPIVERILGYKPEEILGKHFYDFFHPEDRDDLKKAAFDTFAAIKPFREFTNRNIHKNGTIVWLSTSGVPIVDKAGNLLGYRGADSDISAHIEAVNTLKESEQFIYSTLNALTSHIAIIDQTGIIQLVNDAWRNFADANQTVQGNVCEGANYLDMCVNIEGPDSDQAAEFARGIQSVLTGKQSEFHMEYSCHSPDERRWFLGHVTRLSGDSLSRAVIAHENITAWKKTEELLKQSEERTRAMSDSSMDAIILMDGKGIISYFNNAAQRMFGYEKEEVMGEKLHSLIVSEKARSLYNQRLPRFEKTGVCDVIGKKLEVMATRKDGTRFPVELSISCFKINGEWHSSGTVHDIAERKKMEHKLKEAAITDELTGLFNRRGFHTFADKQLKLAQRKKQMVSLAYLDLDNMKAINDTLGHSEGDKALIDIANILKNTFRESDIIARIGGDEFAVLLVGHASPKVDNVIINNVQNKTRSFNELNDREYQLCLSIGVAHCDPARPCSIDELMTQADSLMYEDKKRKIEGETTKEPGDEFIEKRSFQRYKTGDDCWAALDGSDRISIKDVSLGGICLRTLEQVSNDSVHEIKIVSSENKEIKSGGTVVRSSPVSSADNKGKDSAFYETALRFDVKNIRFNKSLEKFLSSLVN